MHHLESKNIVLRSLEPSDIDDLLRWENNPENASKVVDENGEPLVVSHFTDQKFDVFKYKEGGFHFGDASLKDDLEIANLIFASGFSTAEAVTEVSGRGVGMDAVKQFLIKEGGSIQIYLDDDKESSVDVNKKNGAFIFSIEGDKVYNVSFRRKDYEDLNN